MAVKIICTALCVLLIQLTAATVYKDCGSTAATLTSVDVSNCPTGTVPCPFKRGTNITLTLTLTPTEDSKTVSQYLYGYIASVKTPFPTTKDACQNKNIACPVVKGTQTKYSISIFVLPAYPKLRLVVESNLVTDDGKKLACIQVPAEITD